MRSQVFTQSISSEGKGQLSNTIGYYAAFMALGLAGGSLGPTLPSLAKQTCTQLADISILFFVRSLGYLLACLRGGRFYDCLPGNPVMAVVVMTMAVMMFFIPLTPWLWLLVLISLMLGTTEGMIEVGANTLLVWVHRDNAAPFLNGLHFCFGVGACLSPIIIAQMVVFNGEMTWAYWVLAFLMLPIVGWLLPLSSPKSRVMSKDGSGDAIDSLLVFLVALFLLLYVGAEASFGGWIFTYTVVKELSSEAAAAYLTSVFWGTLTLGRLLAIPLTLRFKLRTLLAVDLVGCLVSGGIILLWSNSFVAIWLGTVGMGLSMASMFPTTVALAERHMTITAQVAGWFFVGAGTGGMSLPWVIGQLFESLGPHMMMVAIIADLIAAVGIFTLLLFSIRNHAERDYADRDALQPEHTTQGLNKEYVLTQKA